MGKEEEYRRGRIEIDGRTGMSKGKGTEANGITRLWRCNILVYLDGKWINW